MKRKLLLVVLVVTCILFNSLLTVLAADSSTTALTVKQVVTQVITLPAGMDEYVIDAYVNSGWRYNSVHNQLERDVTYGGREIDINGNTYLTDDNGKVDIVLSPSTSKEVSISFETVRPNSDMILEKNVNARKAGEVTVYDVVVLNDVLAGMSGGDTVDSGNSGHVQWDITYYDQEPSNGQTVHCNRFNGYLGNGKFIDSHIAPQALLNFLQSDCDVALANSTACLADYDPDLSKRYCSTYSYAQAATCSTIVGHSRGYHKHTGFFSPAQ